MLFRQHIVKFGFSGFLLFGLFALSLFILIHEPVRQELRKYFSPAERKILSVAIGQVTPEGSARVLKVLTPRGVQIEVYAAADGSNIERLIEAIPLGDTHDGYIQFQGRATNLALKDMNGDHIYEIIAPTYNGDLVPQLHIYSFNVATQKFEILKQ